MCHHSLCMSCSYDGAIEVGSLVQCRSMTLSLTETGRNSYRQKLDKNSTLVKGFRKEAEQELEARLEKWGINPVRCRLLIFTNTTNILLMAS